jgi:hypothetical protein
MLSVAVPATATMPDTVPPVGLLMLAVGGIVSMVAVLAANTAL